ncbi:MAG: hypothetical protein BGO82_17220 [Devosia sp. 67-54]|uniref:DUF1833 family protein n=1 Tax=unclassified Devosia TaxID=196773 RepID=UPI00086E4177|nr:MULTISPECIES: DUF1833 family protein [unclassified Devosia]MBN9304116.1 DUF1833 family protein [Devosia sp.]ODU54764.1 MAG: hypothetical protein ABS99_08750 [Acetobacteraceae bacterium SCN 69-10]OJX17950.1 MAG: hypothetical protein BGO82_17220 [Devosia sp. 67-54]
MSALSLTFRTAAHAERTGEVLVLLATVTHESLETPIRVSSDPTTRLGTDPLRYGTVSRGDTYEFYPMSLVLPEDSEDTVPAMQWVLDNISRQLVPLLRSVQTPAKVTIELVLASAPDTVEASWPEFDLVAAQPNALTVELTLSTESDAAEPYPSGLFTPAGFGGLF